MVVDVVVLNVRQKNVQVSLPGWIPRGSRPSSYTVWRAWGLEVEASNTHHRERVTQSLHWINAKQKLVKSYLLRFYVIKNPVFLTMEENPNKPKV